MKQLMFRSVPHLHHVFPSPGHNFFRPQHLQSHQFAGRQDLASVNLCHNKRFPPSDSSPSPHCGRHTIAKYTAIQSLLVHCNVLPDTLLHCCNQVLQSLHKLPYRSFVVQNSFPLRLPITIMPVKFNYKLNLNP